MSTSVLLLVLVSTVAHASWNLLARSSRSESLYVKRMLAFNALAGLVPAVAGAVLLGCMTPQVTAFAVLSGVFCGFYFYSLVRGYTSGDFTVVYPVARALPALLIGVWDALRGSPPTLLGWAGLGMVSVGCVVVPQRSLKDFRLSRYLTWASVWILLTAGATVGYSVLDKMGQELMAGENPSAAQAAVYGYFFYAPAWAVFAILSLFGRRRRPAPEGGDPGWRLPALSGTLSFLAYWLILYAYQVEPRASYVVAFRQFSIVIGVVAAFALFKEPGRRIRTMGACVIVAGLVMLQVWG